MKSFTKDPQARLDYVFNWTEWLATDEEIATADVIVPVGITVESENLEDGKVTVWLSGGTGGETYIVTCHIETDQQRIDDRHIQVRVRDR